MDAFSFYQQPTFVVDSYIAPLLANNECPHQEIPFHARFHDTTGSLHNTEMGMPIGDHQVITQMVEKKTKNVDVEKGKERKYNCAVRKPHSKKQKKKVAEEAAAPSGYVHVRARRGQATDSRSLAERITGKTLILDEIIKYVQTLQAQVEILAAKLTSVTPMFNDSEREYFITNPLPQEAASYVKRLQNNLRA